jgi:NADH-quinone oxidoreductase subunit A
MTGLVLFIVIFLLAGGGVLAGNLALGRLVRPHRPSPEKGTVYECGEPAVGPSWVQFDLRFYVVALLFVIFDVELAFFFPWAVVFGTANRMADPNLPSAERQTLGQTLIPAPERSDPFAHVKNGSTTPAVQNQVDAAKSLAWIAFADLLVFFGVLLVGFAYLWRRGDLEWVRSYAAQGEGGASGQPVQSSPHGTTTQNVAPTPQGVALG